MFEQEYAPRSSKAGKIAIVLEDYLGDRLQDALVLDLGCSNGKITFAMDQVSRYAVGVDIDRPALLEARRRDSEAGRFAESDGACLPFRDETFDVVTCAQVYEHAENQSGMAAEVWRVLRPNGVCFFSGPNRFTPIEEHYWLPFLSWFPKRASDWYLRLAKRGTCYDIKPMTYWQLHRLWRGFHVVDYTPRLFNQPDRYGVADEFGRLLWLSRLPLWFWKMLRPLLPNFNWILVKQ